MVKVIDGPVQVIPALVKLGITVMVAVTGALPVLTAVKEGISPVPPAAKPMDRSLLLQVNKVPVTGPVIVIRLEVNVLQIEKLLTGSAVGMGLTSIT